MEAGLSPPCARLLKRLSPLILLYLVIVATVFYFVAHSEAERIRDSFIRQAKEVFRQADVKAKTFEICLDGFAHFLQAQTSLDYHKARQFAATLRNSYPELYMFELAERVKAAERPAFERRMQQLGFPDFRIHSFDHSGERVDRPVPPAASYFPITLVEPYGPAVKTVLGLDLTYSSAQLRDAVLTASRSGRQQASRPFHLAEGGMGYLLYRPFRLANSGTQEFNYFALAAVRISDLIPPATLATRGWMVQVQHPASTPVEEPGHFDPVGIDPVGGEPLATARLWFTLPALQLHFRLSSASQPLTLRISYHPSLADLDLRFIGIVAALLLTLTLLFFRMLCRSRRQALMEQNYIDTIVGRANYDRLTGLPNINLLMDRLEQCIKQAQRSGQKVAICYLDFDKFKAVNDRLGHDAGDQLLCKASSRIQGVLRDADTVARIHGDEYIILLPAANSRRSAEHTVNKIKTAFERPLYVKDTPITIGVSTGVALYPDEEIEALMAVADRRMYADKQPPASD